MPLTPLVVSDLSYSYAARPDRAVLHGVSFAAAPGTRLGLIGENGSGKSTLLRLLADAHPVAGYLPQDSGLDLRMSVADVLRAALAPLHELVDSVERLAPSDPAAYAEALDAAVAADAWDADRRARVAAAELGLKSLSEHQRIGDLSGGQRSRLALACLVVRRPSTVLLDEPTNHLDDDGLSYLESELLSLPGVVVAASHDRVFLDNVCTQLYDLDARHFGTDGQGGRGFGGTYSAYRVEKQAERERWVQAHAAQRDQIAALQAAARVDTTAVAHNRPARDNDKFIYKSKSQNVQRAATRRAKNAQNRLDELRDNEIRKPRPPLAFAGLANVAGGSAMIRNLEVPGRLKLARLDVSPGEHLLVTGANGSGKSTLMAVLAGEAPSVSGAVEVHARRIGYLPQHDDFTDPNRTPVEIFESACAAGTFSGSLSDLGLVHPRDAQRPVGDSSLGQQRRLALACVIAQSPDLLLLDEPTNHLSLDLVEDLEEAVSSTRATVVVTSHDRWWRSAWTGTHVALPA